MLEWSLEHLLALSCLSPLCFQKIRRIFTLLTIWNSGHFLFNKRYWWKTYQDIISGVPFVLGVRQEDTFHSVTFNGLTKSLVKLTV